MFAMMRKCLDWRLLVGFAVLLGGLAIVAPSLLWAALPLLLVAACPLMLLTMGVGGMGMARKRTSAHQRGEPVDGNAPAEARTA